MIASELSPRLVKNTPCLPVDFNKIDGCVYFGELKFLPGSGMEDFSPIAWDYKIGEWVKMDRLAKESKLK